MDIYITRDELRNKPYSLSQDVVDGKYLEVLQDLTKDVIDRVCIQPFDQEGTVASPVEKKVTGTGKDTVFTPKRLIELVDVRIYSSSLNYVTYEASNFTVKSSFITWNVYAESYSSLRLGVENFPVGQYNVGIRGTWGWAVVPNPIKYLQGKMIKKIIEDEAFAERFNSERMGDYNYEVAVRGDEEYPITGDRELDLIIKQYRASTFAMRVI